MAHGFLTEYKWLEMNPINEKVSKTLKTLRTKLGWSLDTTSLKTGVSKAMLGQIERGESSPTIATLWKIAKGFDISFSFLVEDLNTLDLDFINRSSHLKEINTNDEKMRVLPIFAYDENLEFEVFVIELLPGCEHLSVPHQAGVIEHIIVAEGEIEVFVNNVWYPLKQHEGIRFNADKPHGYRNASSNAAVFHDMVHYNVHSKDVPSS